MAPSDDHPGHVPRTRASPDSDVRSIDRQRRENENLRAALRTRAVIEQAKGILVARTGLDPETAFQRLIQQSQRTNRKLTRIAAEIVATTVTGEADGAHRPQAVSPLDVAGSTPEPFIAAAAVIAAPELTRLLDEMLQHTQRFGVTAGILALAEPDGALRIVAHRGFDAHVNAGWLRIPADSALPMSVVARTRRPVWFHDRTERERRYPDNPLVSGHHEACAVIPLERDRRLVGVLRLDWETSATFSTSVRGQLQAAAELLADPVATLLRDADDPLPGLDFEPGRSRWFWAFLDAQPVAQIVLEPQIDRDSIVDLVVVHANAEATGTTLLTAGRSLLEYFPRATGSDLVEHAAQVLRSTAPYRLASLTVPAADGTTRLELEELAMVRVGTMLVVSWARWAQR